MVAKLDNLGFKVEKEFDKPKEIVDGFSINPDRINIEQEKGSKEMTINFGMDNIYTDGDEEKTDRHIWYEGTTNYRNDNGIG